MAEHHEQAEARVEMDDDQPKDYAGDKSTDY
jgi:hypothetical protein